MRRLFLAALLLATPAAAQQANVVNSCGSVAPFGALKAGQQFFPTIDIHGQLCLAGGSLTALEDEIKAIQARLDNLEKLEPHK
jgi:hypothetical protein